MNETTTSQKPVKRGRPKIYTEEECRARRNAASKKWYAKNHKPTGRPRGRPRKTEFAKAPEAEAPAV